MSYRHSDREILHSVLLYFENRFRRSTVIVTNSIAATSIFFRNPRLFDGQYLIVVFVQTEQVEKPFSFLSWFNSIRSALLTPASVQRFSALSIFRFDVVPHEGLLDFYADFGKRPRVLGDASSFFLFSQHLFSTYLNVKCKYITTIDAMKFPQTLAETHMY